MTGNADRSAILAHLRENLPFFGAHALSILDKAGQKRNLHLNRAQLYVHERLEEQKKRTGKVRALILKGRQQGVSTYIAARFYHRTSMNPGTGTLIMAHEAKATSNLFKMVKRYDDHNPLAPSKAATNAQELVFGRMDSSYRVATAGSKDTGRSMTAQLFHASEFAFWENAQEHLAGIGNAIGDVSGSEMVLESTGNGLGNAFHLLWQAAEKGEGEWIAIFVPWYWQPEYTAPVPEGFALSDKDETYQKAFGLTLGQMAWRRNKIVTYGPGFEWLFDQEYPATPAHAFQSPTANPLISPILVARAMNSDYCERYGSHIIGCDPAEFGDDRTAIAFRHGRTCYRIESHVKKGPMEVAGMLADLYRRIRPDAIIVDKIGIGSGIVDRLRELQVPVIGMNSGERAERNDVYANKRAEGWWLMQEWLEDYPCRLPNDMALMSDLVAPGFKHNSNGLKLVESKDDMKKRGLRSPDLADAVMMTFGATVIPASASNEYGSTGQYTGPATKAGY